MHDPAGHDSRLHRLIDTTPVPMALLEGNGRVTHLNQSFVETFGYPPEQIPTLEAWWPLAYPDPAYRAKVHDEWCGRILAANSGADLAPYESHVTARDGGVHTIEWHTTHLGEQSLVVGLDLTERLRQNEALRTTEARYRLLLEHAPEAIVVLDADTHRFIDCNPSAERLFGLTRAELSRVGPLDVSPPRQPDGRDSAPAAEALINAALNGGTSVAEWTHYDRNRRPILCEVRLLRMPDPAGRRLIRGSILDISERRAAEDTLRENEERFRLLIENSTELVAQVDERGNYIYASPNHTVITGYTPEELLGRSVFEFIHPGDAPRVRAAFESGAEQSTRVFRFQFKAGNWRWLESAGRRFRTSHGVEMGAIISRDITLRVEAEETRKRLEAQLRQAQKMEAIGTLAGGIAHDFNNILAGLFGSLQLAEEELPPDHAARPLLQASFRASVRARDLVAKILTFSRRREQHNEVQALEPIVQEAVGLLRASLPATVQIRTEFTATNTFVQCDAVQMHQVVMNLATNAAHAMTPRGGTLTITLDTTPPDPAMLAAHPRLQPGALLRLAVSDTGAGMDAATRERIFEPFFTTKPVGEGTGLGLAVVHGIVDDHGGAIAVESAPGAGTHFSIWLPQAERAAPRPVAASTSTPRGRGERLLFVDDEPAVCDIGARLLRGLGYDVVEFTRSVDALHEFRRTPSAFAIVASDLTMPELNGPELVEEVRRLRPDIPVLVMTGYLRADEVERVRRAGVRHFLEKPFTMDALAETVRRTLDGN